MGGLVMVSFSDLFKAKSCGLVLPRDEEDEINRYVAMHSGDRESIERRPFPRQIDFWAYCVAAALALGLEPRKDPVSRWGKSFIYTYQGVMDNHLCSLLAVVAVAKLGHEDPEAIEIRRIVDLANCLAAAGCSEVLKRLSEDTLRTTPLDQALELARTLQGSVRADS